MIEARIILGQGTIGLSPVDVTYSPSNTKCRGIRFEQLYERQEIGSSVKIENVQSMSIIVVLPTIEALRSLKEIIAVIEAKFNDDNKPSE